MSGRAMLGAMIAGTALVILVTPRRASPPKQPIAPGHVAEQPWLTKEAAAQIVGEAGALGPLFAGVELGGPAPPRDVRERIETFARANHVAIELQIVDANLASVRFAVTYGGCCGYEAADVLGLRLRRPSADNCCDCGRGDWIDDWAVANEDGTYMRAAVRVNRVEVRWERVLTLTGLLERANHLIGLDAAAVRANAAERWVIRKVASPGSGEPGIPQDFLAVPYVAPDHQTANPIDLRSTDDLGFRVVVEQGRIAEVSFVLRELEDVDTRRTVMTELRAIWGRPFARSREHWTWRMTDRSVTAELDRSMPRVTIRAGTTVRAT